MKHQDLISKMTLEEKASLCSGKDFWHLKGLENFNIPEIMVCDGPHGLRKQYDKSTAMLEQSVPATCFPSAQRLPRPPAPGTRSCCMKWAARSRRRPLRRA